MKINSPRRRNSKLLLLSLSAVTLLLVGGLAFAYTKNTWPFEAAAQDTTSENDPITPEQKKAIDTKNAQDKQDFLDKEVSNDANTDNTEKPGGQKADPKIDLAARTQDNLLVVTTSLPDVTSGECTLTLQQGQNTVTKTAKVIFAPGSSTCEGFSIDKSELGTGQWQITLFVKTDDNKLSKSINYSL